MVFSAKSRLDLEGHPQRTDLSPGMSVGRDGLRRTRGAAHVAQERVAIGECRQSSGTDVFNDLHGSRNRTLAQTIATAVVVRIRDVRRLLARGVLRIFGNT